MSITKTVTGDKQKRSCPTVLAIGGLDPSGGAGILLDAYAIRAAGASAAVAVCVTTVQDGNRFVSSRVHEAEEVRCTIRVLMERFPVGAVKTGALGNNDIIGVVAALATLPGFGPLVIDPVIYSSSSGRLLEARSLSALRDNLIPKATLVTPNLAEAEALTGMPVRDIDGMRRAAQAIIAQGAGAVLVKGGHLTGDMATDLLRDRKGDERLFHHKRQSGPDVRGTGCALASLIAAFVAGGDGVFDAVEKGQEMLQRAIHTAVQIGDGPPHLGNFV